MVPQYIYQFCKKRLKCENMSMILTQHYMYTKTLTTKLKQQNFYILYKPLITPYLIKINLFNQF